MGISRSATVVCAYLIATNNWGAKKAIDYVRLRRPITDPNDGFRLQLAVYAIKYASAIDDGCAPKDESKDLQTA